MRSGPAVVGLPLLFALIFPEDLFLALPALH